MPKTIAGPPCPECGFPVSTKPFRIGEIVQCPDCGEESEVSSEPIGSVGSSSTKLRDFAVLGTGAFLLFIFTKAKKDTRVR